MHLLQILYVLHKSNRHPLQPWLHPYHIGSLAGVAHSISQFYFPPSFANKFIKKSYNVIFWIFFLILSVIVEVYLWWKLQASLIFLSGRTCTIDGWLNTFLPHYMYVGGCTVCTQWKGVLLHVLHRKWAKANESQVEKTINCIIFLLVNIVNGSHIPEHHTRVKMVNGQVVLDIQIRETLYAENILA